MSGRESPSDLGSTFAEALLAIALFAVVCTGASSGARATLEALRTVHRLAQADRRLVLADRLVRRSVSRVRFPARAGVLPAELHPDRLRLGYLDGDRNRFLEIAGAGGRLTVKDGAEVERVAGFESVSVSFLSIDGYRPHCAGGPVVYVSLQDAGGERVSIRAQTGTWPLPAPDRAPRGKR